MIGRVRESRNPKKVIRVALMESYGEIRRVPVNLYIMIRYLFTEIPVQNLDKLRNVFLNAPGQPLSLVGGLLFNTLPCIRE